MIMARSGSGKRKNCRVDRGVGSTKSGSGSGSGSGSRVYVGERAIDVGGRVWEGGDEIFRVKVGSLAGVVAMMVVIRRGREVGELLRLGEVLVVVDSIAGVVPRRLRAVFGALPIENMGWVGFVGSVSGQSRFSCIRCGILTGRRRGRPAFSSPPPYDTPTALERKSG